MSIPEQKEAPDSKFSRGDWIALGAVLLVGASLFLGMQWKAYRDDLQMLRYVSLAENSKAHEYIVPAYRQCLRARNPGHTACKGAVAQSAEMDGYTPDAIKKVFIDIERLNAEYR